jgi:ATP-dependent helicase/nuclease subunit A
MSVPLPDWVHEPSSARIETQKTLSPSDLGGAKALPGDAGLDEDAALLHGRQIHLLLEHLPVYPESDWPKMGRALLAFGPDAATEGGADRLVAKVGVILTDPKLSHLFAADALAEVSITADLPELNSQRIHGTIDRLIVEETTVLAVDFKSNATVPKRQEDTPSGLLRQMGAYLSALQQIYPDKSVNVAILWTTTGDLMPLSHEIVMSALSSTATS